MMILTNCRTLSLAVICLLGFAAGQLRAHPEPTLAGASWQLSFTYEQPQTIAVVDIDGRFRWYWFMPYKVVNNTATEQFFVPEVTIASDDGAIVTAGRGVRPAVFRAIAKRLGNPLLENPVQVSGRILIGEDHAKESVAIWPAPGRDVDELRIFVAGLSGETQTITLPASGKAIELRKALMVVYNSPGSSENPQLQPIRFKSEKWVMR